MRLMHICKAFSNVEFWCSGVLSETCGTEGSISFFNPVVVYNCLILGVEFVLLDIYLFLSYSSTLTEESA